MQPITQFDLATLTKLVEEYIPFNKFLGLKLHNFDAETGRLTTRLELRPEFVGNAQRQMPHGGILSFVIDATSGVAAAAALDDPALAVKLSTVDMRVDYLKPARGQTLYTHSEVMRSGNRTIVVRSEIVDEVETRVALGLNVFNVSR